MLRTIDHSTAHTTPGAEAAEWAVKTDEALAKLVHRAFKDLARHDEHYARLFANRAGIRLSYHVQAGQIDRLSDEGRVTMQATYLSLQAALALEPGLDTNAFRARLSSTH